MAFHQFCFGALIFYLSLSHTLRHLELFLENSWRSVAYLGFGVRRQRKRRKAQEDIEINNYNRFFLQIPSYTYDFLTTFGMHGICMWLFGHECL